MVYVIIGRREQGKTTLMYYMGSKIDRRLIFDPRRLVTREGSVRTHTPDALAEACDQLAAGTVREVVYSPDGNLQRGFEAYAAEVERWIRDDGDKSIAFMIDEANKDFINTDIDSFQWAMRCCSREQHHIMLTVHRPSDLSTRVRALADHWCLFAIRQEHDLDVVQSRCGREVVQLVQTLEARQFVWWNDGKASYEIRRDASAWKIAVSAPRRVELPGEPRVAGLDSLPHEELPKVHDLTTSKLF